MRKWLQWFIAWQMRLSKSFDRLIDLRYRIDGNDDFKENVLPQYISRGMVIFDVGGGSRPYIDLATKVHQDLTVVGLDVDQGELDAAPAGAYDRVICTDIASYVGTREADLVICQSTLEHVKRTQQAFAAFATIVRQGGRIAIFVPSKNALFARINLLLPEKLKKFLLYNIFPHKAGGHDGFPAFYDRCTPRDFREMAKQHGLEIELQKLYFTSSYFSFFAPLYVLWRLWILGFHRLAGDQAAETFVMVLRNAGRDKSAESDDAVTSSSTYQGHPRWTGSSPTRL
jgi:SAM-dependent methyltransferase